MLLIRFDKQQKHKMQNIEIKRNKNKRSIESLIEESALDNSFNYQAHQLRKAFNQTLQAMNLKQLEHQKENQKLKIILREYEDNKLKAERRIENMQAELADKNKTLKQLGDAYKEAKKRLQYVQYKLQIIHENREEVERQQVQRQEIQNEEDKKKRIVNEIYKQMERVVARKIESFTIDVKKMAMSVELEQRIETFLEELIYLNPHSEYKVIQQIKKEKKENLFGKITKERHERNQKEEQWRVFEKSLQKLKQLNREHISTVKKADIQQLRQKSVSKDKRRRLFN